MLLRYVKRRFSLYTSPSMLIIRKVTKFIVVKDFKHLNVRIAKKM